MLPTEKTKKNLSLARQVVLVYGPPKIGKSTFCSHIPGALFLSTEPGLNGLEVFSVPVSSWAEFVRAMTEIEAGDHDFRTLVIDTVDNLYGLCERVVCDELGISSPDDLDYGKGWKKVNSRFSMVLSKMATMQIRKTGGTYGLVLVSHSVVRTIKGRTGNIDRTVPSIPKSTGMIVEAMADLVLYLDTADDGTNARYIRTKPTAAYMAGDRTGLLPESIPFTGTSADWISIESYLTQPKQEN
jgi:hypothetical protein